MIVYQHALAKHSLASLLEAGQLLGRQGEEGGPSSTAEAAAEMIRGLCDGILWADRRLDGEEERLMDAILQEDAAYGGPVAGAIAASAPQEGFLETIPRCLRYAQRHDHANGTCVARIMVNSLESLGWILVCIGGERREEAARALEAYVELLRTFVQAGEERLAAYA
jgi:hypothetical protein